MDRMEAAVACGMGCGIRNYDKTQNPLSSPSSSSSLSSPRVRCPSRNSACPRRIFDVFDNNGDAMITVNEISKALSLMGLEAEITELDSLIRLYIKPGNEGLRYEDFMALYESLGLGDTHEEEKEEKDLSEAFKVFDEDGDGYISARELQVVLGKLGFAEGNEIDRVQRMIVSVDTNHDGRVDFFEFKHMMRHALHLSTS